MGKSVPPMPGAPTNHRNSVFDEYRNCDGYVRDVPSALVAMALSSAASILALFFIERAKLFIYQRSE